MTSHLTCGWRVWCLMSLQTIRIPKVAIPTDNYADGIFNFVPSSAISFVQDSHGVSIEFAVPLIRCRRGWIATRSHPKCTDLMDLVPQQQWHVQFPQPTFLLRVPCWNLTKVVRSCSSATLAMKLQTPPVVTHSSRPIHLGFGHLRHLGQIFWTKMHTKQARVRRMQNKKKQEWTTETLFAPKFGSLKLTGCFCRVTKALKVSTKKVDAFVNIARGWYALIKHLGSFRIIWVLVKSKAPLPFVHWICLNCGGMTGCTHGCTERPTIVSDHFL